MKKNVYFVQVDVSSGKDSKVVYLPYTAGVIVANAFSDEAASLCSAMKHLLLANMKHKRLAPLV